ncbi:MAG: gluconokinase [Lentisphaeraceae bacterium]|nr:gluconokinase [Lentisphaeraceae bacterium]
MVYIVMGVSGCGKRTVGELLAKELQLPFYDGDNFHPQSNIDKMASGNSLDDDDRQPWLEIIAHNIKNWNGTGGAVIACSALKEKYRETLGQFGQCKFVFLDGSKELILGRMQAREHFMPPALLNSQFDTLEKPRDAIQVDINLSFEEIIVDINNKISQE